MRLKRLRQAAGISQQELASRAGLSVSLVAKLEHGKEANPRLSTLYDLADILGAKLSELVPDDRPRGIKATKARRSSH